MQTTKSDSEQQVIAFKIMKFSILHVKKLKLYLLCTDEPDINIVPLTTEISFDGSIEGGLVGKIKPGDKEPK